MWPPQLEQGDLLGNMSPEPAIYLQAFSAGFLCLLPFGRLVFYNKNWKGIADVLKSPFSSRSSDFFVGVFTTLRSNLPDRSVFSGLTCVINSEKALICCDLNVYLFYPEPTRQLQMLSCLRPWAWKCSCHSESCNVSESWALCSHLARITHRI